jgi:tRNA pseudouridine32 synthase/23S rRNA pseudouridine746 synthase
MKADPHGLPSSTTWKVMGRGDGIAWLALEPLTGRTHQLRVHCAEMGFPIVGDTIYGTQTSLRSRRNENSPRQGGPPLQLHARAVTVPISKNKPPVTVDAPVPAHMRDLLVSCGWKDDK